MPKNFKLSNKKAAIIFVAVAFLVSTFYILHSTFLVYGFTGPGSQGAGSGVGAIGVDASNNLSVGTSTTKSSVKLLIVGSSTAPGEFAIQVLNVNAGPVFLITNDGRVTIGSTSFASGTGAGGTFGPQPAFGGLFVHGPIQTDLDVKALGGLSVGTTTLAGAGNILMTGTISGLSISAGNITAGVFGGIGNAANYAFEGNVGFGTSSQVGLPQKFSVYGSGYFSGNVGIGTSAPTNPLTLNSTATVAEQINGTGANTYIYLTNGSGTVQFGNYGGQAFFQAASGYDVGLYDGTGALGVLVKSAYTQINPFLFINHNGNVSMVINSAGSNYGMIQNDAGDVWSLAYKGVYTSLGTPVLSWTGGGKVGIGTTYPSSTLHVIGDLRVSASATIPNLYDAGGNKYVTSTSAGGGSVSTSSAITANYFPYWANVNGGLSGTSTLYFSAGYVGIGTTAPTSTLHVVGDRGLFIDSATNGGFPGRLRMVDEITEGSGAHDDFLIETDGGLLVKLDRNQNGAGAGLGFDVFNSNNVSLFLVDAGTGRVGIGTIYPSSTLHVIGTVTATTLSGALAASNVTAGVFGGAGSGALYAFPSNLGVGTSSQVGLPATLSVYGTSTFLIGNVGIGTSSPQALLSVGNNSTATVAIFGGGTGKIAVGTIDPVYTIGGKQYATYSPETIGIKVETVGNIECKIENGKCEYVVDFNNLEEGSDLWLFAKTTNLKNNFDKLSTFLTAGFDGRVWYKIDAKELTLTIFALPSSVIDNQSSVEVSYRLTALRFDAASWPNIVTDSSGAGFIITN